MRIAIAGLTFFLVLAIGGFLVLAGAPLSPPVQKVEKFIPDDQIPR